MVPAFSAVAVNVCMNFILIPAWGMMGAACSVVLAQITYTSLLAWLSDKQMAVHFEWGKIALIYCLAIGIFGISQYLTIENFWIDGLIKLSLLTIFPVVLYKFNFFEEVEIQSVKRAVLKFVSKFRKL